jgi:hypothetical protein
MNKLGTMFNHKTGVRIKKNHLKHLNLKTAKIWWFIGSANRGRFACLFLFLFSHPLYLHFKRSTEVRLNVHCPVCIMLSVLKFHNIVHSSVSGWYLSKSHVFFPSVIEVQDVHFAEICYACTVRMYVR